MGTQAQNDNTIKNLVQETTDYSQFKLMEGNREVDPNHVKRLKKEMRYNPSLLQAAPILVNEKLYVIDGQHRLRAAEDLKMPVFYMVKSGLTIDATRHMNVAQKRWTLMDFAHSHAAGGNKSYIEFINAVNKFPRIAPAIIMKYFSGGQTHELGDEFRRGDLRIPDLEQSLAWLEKLSMVTHQTNTLMNTPMAVSFLKLFRDNFNEQIEFDFDKFMRKLQHEGAVQLFATSNTVRNCLRIIEDVYNFMSNTRTRLY